MGSAAYNRGSRAISRDADAAAAPAVARSERQALKDENARLKEQIEAVQTELERARRCLAAERHGREQLRLRLAQSARDYEFGVEILCGLAFPKGARS